MQRYWPGNSYLKYCLTLLKKGQIVKYLKLILMPCFLIFWGCSSVSALNAPAPNAKASYSASRQVIRTANVTVTVDNIDEKSVALSNLVKAHEGYVKSKNQFREKTTHFSVKVPSEALGKFLELISSLGEVTHRSTSSDDVTEQIVDIEARLKNLTVLRNRYRQLLEKANTVEEILSIERELSKVQTEIDSIEGRRKSLLDQVAMSSVTVTLEQKTIYGPLGYVGKGLMWAIGKLFVIQ